MDNLSPLTQYHIGLKASLPKCPTDQLKQTIFQSSGCSLCIRRTKGGSSSHSACVYSGLLVSTQLNVFDFDLIPKPLYIYCISDCLRKGCNYAKSACLVSTKSVLCSETLNNSQGLHQGMTNTTLRNRDSPK